jgi:hypothetical protein
MDREQLPPPYNRPAFQVQLGPFRAVLALIGTASSVILFFAPGIAGLESAPRLRYALILLVLLAAGVSLLFPWLKGVAHAVYGRTKEYPQLHQHASRDSEALNVLRLGAMQLMRSTPSNIEDGDELQESFANLKSGVYALGLEALSEVAFRVQRASIDKGKLIIALEDPNGILHRGDKMQVLDTEDLFEMGTYQVVDVLAKECYAAEHADTDPVWKGNIMEHGEMSVVPSKVAILVERSSENV